MPGCGIHCLSFEKTFFFCCCQSQLELPRSKSLHFLVLCHFTFTTLLLPAAWQLPSLRFAVHTDVKGALGGTQSPCVRDNNSRHSSVFPSCFCITIRLDHRVKSWAFLPLQLDVKVWRAAGLSLCVRAQLQSLILNCSYALCQARRVWYWPSAQLCCGRSRMWAALYQSIMWAAVEFRLNQAGLANKQPSLLGSAAETEQPHARLISDSFIIISAACASQRKGGKEMYPETTDEISRNEERVRSRHTQSTCEDTGGKDIVSFSRISPSFSSCACVYTRTSSEWRASTPVASKTYNLAQSLEIYPPRHHLTHSSTPSSLSLSVSASLCVSVVTRKSHLTVTWRNAWRWFRAIIPPPSKRRFKTGRRQAERKTQN